MFDLFGTLVPEFSTSDFFGSVRDMARALGADRDRFEDAWRQTAEARQTGVFATVEDNVRHICADALPLIRPTTPSRRRSISGSSSIRRGSIRAEARSKR